MNNLSLYIQEKLKIDKDVKDKDSSISEKIYNVLSDEKYKLNFKHLRNNYESYIYLIPYKALSVSYKGIIKDCFGIGGDLKDFDTDNGGHYRLFKIAINNSGNLYFNENPKYSQGEVLNHMNNTDFVYYILNYNNACELCGYYRKYYGQPPSIGKIYEFTI